MTAHPWGAYAPVDQLRSDLRLCNSEAQEEPSLPSFSPRFSLRLLAAGQQSEQTLALRQDRARGGAAERATCLRRNGSMALTYKYDIWGL